MNNKPPIQASNLSLRNKDATLVERQGPNHYGNTSRQRHPTTNVKPTVRPFDNLKNGVVACPRIGILSCVTCWPEPNRLIPEPWICT